MRLARAWSPGLVSLQRTALQEPTASSPCVGFAASEKFTQEEKALETLGRSRQGRLLFWTLLSFGEKKKERSGSKIGNVVGHCLSSHAEGEKQVNLSDEDEVRTSKTTATLRAAAALDLMHLAAVGASAGLLHHGPNPEKK